MFAHLIWCFGFGFISVPAFYFKFVNIGIVLLCVVYAAYNGSTYMFYYMTKYYEKGLQSREILLRP